MGNLIKQQNLNRKLQDAVPKFTKYVENSNLKNMESILKKLQLNYETALCVKNQKAIILHIAVCRKGIAPYILVTLCIVYIVMLIPFNI